MPTRRLRVPRLAAVVAACAGLLSACLGPSDSASDGGSSAMPDGSKEGASGAAGSGIGPRDELGAPPLSTVVVLPDTQFYACAYPDIFDAQVDWIADPVNAKSVALVLHTGDIVDHDVAAQWQVASIMQKLDGVVPYMITLGNHDLDARRNSLVTDYFDTHAFAPAVTFEAAPRPDNSYAVVKLAGRDWLFVGIEFSPRDATLQWAASVLSAHADLPAVVFTHAYLYSDGQRYDRAIVPQQPYHPDRYKVTPNEGINDGEDIWQKLVLPNENVRLVLSGHVIPDGTARAMATRPSGSVVHEVLANYQLCDLCPCAEVQGGNGYLRILQFDEAADRVRVTTYSPHTRKWLTDGENSFDLNW